LYATSPELQLVNKRIDWMIGKYSRRADVLDGSPSPDPSKEKVISVLSVSGLNQIKSN